MTLKKEIRPQEGFQQDFLKSPADIVIGGGAAGAGKTFALVLEPLRYINVKGFGGVIFRRTYPQITLEGGLWDTSSNIYQPLGLIANKTSLEWRAGNGNKLKFGHLQHEKNIYDYQGSQIPFIGFDEITHFTEKMFFYLLSRNRTTCGVRPYVRATCNPDPDSWVKRLIQWWIDPETGYPIPERAGVLRYFTRDNNQMIWGNTKQEVIDQCAHVFEKGFEGIDKEDLVKSLTFIPGDIYGNKELLRVNPNYLGDLLAQDDATKSQLLEGNWNVKIDSLSIYDYVSINDIFTNEYVKQGRKAITVDCARFGSDLAVVLVWNGKRVVDIETMEISKTTEIADAVKRLERKYGIPRSQIVVDADGVGGGVVDLLQGVVSFNNGAKPIGGESYENMKTQCYYKSAESVNKGEIYIEPQVAEKEVRTSTFRELLLKDLRAVKRDKPDGDGKKKIISKQQMKNILGRSPDFGDAFMMREYLELNKPGGAPKVSVSRRSF